jgi:hypothetical protein
MLVRRLAILAGFALLALGNDGSATSTPAGGIQLTREPRISMEKERLTIGKSKITVEYEFLNTSDRDITTEVAFPVPPYEWLIDRDLADMNDFQVVVEGKAVKYQAETKAMSGGVNYAAMLGRLGVDVASFGHSSYDSSVNPIWPDIERLSLSQKKDLVRLKLLDPGGSRPDWSVEKTFHWRQTFAAHKRISIRHAYKPIVGIDYPTKERLQSKDRQVNNEVKLSEACVEPSLYKTLLGGAKPEEEFFSGIRAYWVDYILTTANTWKTPIKDFELVIERPKPEEPTSRVYVSLCWDGKIEQNDVDHFVAKKLNFVPSKELRVMFFEVPK